MRTTTLALITCTTLLLAGCDQLGIESTTAIAARVEADGKAIGGGCRHAGRSLEICYGNNKRADKAAVFAGWREMNDYMRENNIEAVPPPPEPPKPKAGSDGEDTAEAADPAAAKSASKVKKTAAKDH